MAPQAAQSPPQQSSDDLFQLCIDDGDPASRIEACSNLIDREPEEYEIVELYSERAMAYMEDRRYEESRQDIEAALALDPDRPEIYLVRSGVECMLGNGRQAGNDMWHSYELMDWQDRLMVQERFSEGNIYNGPIDASTSPAFEITVRNRMESECPPA